MNNRSVLLASNDNVWREPSDGQSQSFLNVIAGVENADVLAPKGAGYLSGFRVRPSVRYLAAKFSHRVASQMSRRWQQMLAQVGLQGPAAFKGRNAELRRLSEVDYAWR